MAIMVRQGGAQVPQGVVSKPSQSPQAPQAPQAPVGPRYVGAPAQAQYDKNASKWQQMYGGMSDADAMKKALDDLKKTKVWERGADFTDYWGARLGGGGARRGESFDDYMARRKLQSSRGAGFFDHYGYAGDAQTKMLKEYQKAQAEYKAEDYLKDMPNQIGQQESQLQNAISNKLMQNRKNLMAQLSQRGMLSSGLRGLQESGLQGQAASDFEQGRADIYQKAQQQAEEMVKNPLLSDVQSQNYAAQLNQRLADLKSQQQASRAALLGSAFGSIGQGVGTGLGNLAAGKKFTGAE